MWYNQKDCFKQQHSQNDILMKYVDYAGKFADNF